MIIKKRSPFRLIPYKLDAEQTLFLDGIRYSIEMADISYTQLRRTLLYITKNGQSQKLPGTNTVKALLSAWSIIDNINRLRNLLTNMRGIKKGSPGRVIFLKNTNEVETLRNVIQHLNKRAVVDELLQTNSAALGSLTWSIPSNAKKGYIYSCYLRPGTLKSSTAPFKIHVGRTRYPVDEITLSIGSNEVCISEVMDSLKKLVLLIENNLKAQFEGLPPGNIDTYMCNEIYTGEIE
ncbi:hypothetical protein ACFLYQ_06940 [Chloroflexota bacterium]